MRARTHSCRAPPRVSLARACKIRFALEEESRAEVMRPRARADANPGQCRAAHLRRILVYDASL
eukprot:1283349-Prymnesium_polylepis.1